jgi:hypothetical protein
MNTGSHNYRKDLDPRKFGWELPEDYGTRFRRSANEIEQKK